MISMRLFAGIAIVIAFVFSTVALIVSCVNASQNNAMIDVASAAQAMERTSTQNQLIVSHKPVVINFDSEAETSVAGTVLYYSDGPHVGYFQVSRSGRYAITFNVALNVTDPKYQPMPATTWISKSGSSIKYGLRNSTPLESEASTTNAHFVHTSTVIHLQPNDSVCAMIAVASDQEILAGDSSYFCLTRLGPV